jgi:hypothetical protein
MSTPVTRSAVVREVEARAHAEFDLRRPLSRTAAGIEDGQDLAIYQWRNRRPIATVIHLPGDEDFTFAAAHLDVVARGSDGPPVEVRLQATLSGLDAARDELRRVTAVLGDPGVPGALDDGAIDRWHEARRVHHGDPTDDRAFANDVFRGRPHGPVTVEITASLNGTERVTVLYAFRLAEG